MKYERIATALLESPWQVHQPVLKTMIRRFAAAVDGVPRAAADSPAGPREHPQVEIAGGVALAFVHGIMGRRLTNLEMECGGFDTAHFITQMRNVADDPSVRVLVVDFDSPGGQAAGTGAAAQALAAVREAGKKVLCYAGGDCASAAYFVAAAGDEIHADPAARVGSISTVCAGVDTSKEWAMKGRELKLFATGKFKATGMDGKEWTPEEEAMMWARVRGFDDEFKGFVRERRPGLAEESMEGQWWYAKDAPAGLIDSTRFESLDALLESVFASLV